MAKNKTKKRVSAATRARLRALRRKFGLGEFKSGASRRRKTKRVGVHVAKKTYSRRKKANVLNSLGKGALGSIAARMLIGNKYGMMQDAAAGAGATVILKGDKVMGAIGGAGAQFLMGALGIGKDSQQGFVE